MKQFCGELGVKDSVSNLERFAICSLSIVEDDMELVNLGTHQASFSEYTKD